MSIYTRIILVALATVYIVDVSGFTEAWREGLRKALHLRALRSLPPFDCGKCATFWACIICALATHSLNPWTVLLACSLSLLSLPIGRLMIFIREILVTITERLINKCN